jgi:hypothetical protein
VCLCVRVKAGGGKRRKRNGQRKRGGKGHLNSVHSTTKSNSRVKRLDMENKSPDIHEAEGKQGKNQQSEQYIRNKWARHALSLTNPTTNNREHSMKPTTQGQQQLTTAVRAQTHFHLMILIHSTPSQTARQQPQYDQISPLLS